MLLPDNIHSGLGFIALLGLAWVLGERSRVVAWRIVLPGVILMVVMCALLLKVSWFHTFFLALNDALQGLESATEKGTGFVFGYLGGASLPYAVLPNQSTFILAFRALPLILVVSALSSLLFYWRVLPRVVRFLSWALEKTLGVGGAVGLSTAANVFLGMVEAPLVVRPYLQRMSRGELFIVMTGGMAGIAGTMMVLYAAIIGPVVPDAMGHILSAAMVTAPGAIVIGALMVPPGRQTEGHLSFESESKSAMDAVTRGTLEGMSLLINIVAMLIVLVALVSVVNSVLASLFQSTGQTITLQRLLGFVMAPLVWLMGIPWSEALDAGALMGTKTVLNEFIAYVEMAKLPASELSERSRLIMTYALCGFANFGSLGIMIGGLASMVPSRRDEIVSLGLRSIVSGTLSTMAAGALVGFLL